MVIKLKKQISSIGSFWKIDKIKFYFVLPEIVKSPLIAGIQEFN
jgi:hypothetical protein